MTSSLSKPKAREALGQLAALTHELRETLLAEMADNGSGATWLAHQSEFQQQTGVKGQREFADAVAQAVTCGCYGLRSFADQLQGTAALTWLVDGVAPLVRDILVLCSETSVGEAHPQAIQKVGEKIRRFLDLDRVEAIQQLVPATTEFNTTEPNAAVVYFYEHFLAVYDQNIRRSKGVFYTPQALVSFVVRSIDVLLREEFSLPRGLADEATYPDLASRFQCPNQLAAQNADTPFVRLLDPAMGTGAFLLEAAALVQQRFRSELVPQGSTVETENQLWNQYVARLLPRICGQELMLPALVVAHLAMTAWLADSGFRFQRPGKLHFHLANTLQQPATPGAEESPPAPPFTIVLGNPPFSGVSDNRQSWMQNLLRGRAPDMGTGCGAKSEVANYFLSEGTPLQEKKHWLQDDYVKFIRFAHWQIEKSRTGIVALVTNHGYLDNSTFRGMREQLLATFPRINIVDLHGNTRNGEQPPDDVPDQSVFGIEQGVAVCLLRRPFPECDARCVAHSDVWGDRTSKIQTLNNRDIGSMVWKQLQPQTPYFFLVPKNHQRLREYDAGFRLCDIMPVNSTAVVTARDGFVVAFDAAELQHRLRQFADLRISDEAIRAQFFADTRSQKYPPGDTRGWRVAEARQRLHDEPDWEQHIRPCLYRPFDQRQIYWAPWMIDWPRTNVTDHLVSAGNLALIARRQMPPAQPCNYFWVSDTIALDGVVRSDNRGSESIFPLFLTARKTLRQATLFEDNAAFGAPNFSVEFIEACSAKLELNWTPDAAETTAGQLTPHNLFHYIYALFHCPSYRQRFAEHLCLDFPRVLIPRQRDLFFAMARSGKLLADNHLLRCTAAPTLTSASLKLTENREFCGVIAPGHPQFHDQTIWLNKTTGIAPVEHAVWEFRVGTYQVCRKWLKDRRQRLLSKSECEQYCRVLQAIATTLRTMADLDHLIDRYGSWETAF